MTAAVRLTKRKKAELDFIAQSIVDATLAMEAEKTLRERPPATASAKP